MRPRICLLSLLLSSALAAQQLPQPPKLHLADLMEKPGYFNEPSIAVNPKNSQELAVAWRVNARVGYSGDGGKTWSKPLTLSSVPALPRDDNGALEGFHGVVAPDGTLYTIWADRDGIMMATSHDGGVTFTKDRQILKTGPAYFTVEGISRS